MARQMRHLDPRQDEIAVVVGDPAEPLCAKLGTPADERVPRRRLPRRSAENRAGHNPFVPIPDEVSDCLTDGRTESEIVVGRKKLVQEPGIVASCRNNRCS